MVKYQQYYYQQLFDMKLLHLLAPALILVLFSTLYSKEEVPFKHVDGILKIFRDGKGVPHIVADSEANLFYGLGYAEAKDRLWAIHSKRMIFLGRSSEMFGSEVLPLDRYTRNINLKEIGEQSTKLMDEETRMLAQAYCDGINDYVKSSNVLPLEFYLFWANWEDWTVDNVNSMLAFFSFNLEFDWMYEMARERLKESVGWRLAMKLIPSHTEDMFIETTIIKDDELKKTGRFKPYDSSKYMSIVEEHWKNLVMTMDEPKIPDLKQTNFGSNAWVVGGKHTKTGRPILSNDPHLGLVLPALFYPVELILTDSKGNIQKQAFGAKNDGMPGLSLGVNKKFAWGATALYADGKDVFVETIRNTTDGNKEYLLDGEWKPLRRRQQSFQVAGLGKHTQVFYHTHRGPLMTTLFFDVHLKYGFPLPQHYQNAISLAAVCFQPDGETVKGMINLAFSQTQEQFVENGGYLKNVNIDSAFITSEGTFGYGAIGRIAKRNIPEMGSFIKNGSTTKYDFGEYYSHEQLPLLMNPERGYVAMTNNKFASDNFDLRGSLHEPSNARALRIDTLLSEQIKSGKKFTLQDMMNYQQDDVDAFLTKIKGKWVSIIKKYKMEWKDNQFSSRIINLIDKWNCSFSKDMIEPAIYSIWEHEFQNLLLQGRGLTETERVTVTNHAYFNSYYFKMIDRLGSSEEITDDDLLVCENNHTKSMNFNPCISNMIIAFNSLEKSLLKWFGTLRQEEWKWGTIHKTYFTYIPWTQVPLLGRIWQRAIPASGNSQTLNVGIHSFQKGSFDAFGSAVFRLVTDIDTTYYSSNTGVSDRVRSPFYDNFSEDFYNGKYEEYKRINPLKDKHDWKEFCFNKK